MTKPYHFTPARAAALAAARERAREKREREGTEPQRLGARKRQEKHARQAIPKATATAQTAPSSDDAREARIVARRPPPPPAATQTDTTSTPEVKPGGTPEAVPSPTSEAPPAQPSRPTPLGDLRTLGRRLISLRRSG